MRSDDSLPKAICHDCLQQLTNMHLYSVKVEKTQKFLEFRSLKFNKDKKEAEPPERPHPVITALSATMKKSLPESPEKVSSPRLKKNPIEQQQGDIKESKSLNSTRKKSFTSMRFMEDMPLEEFVKNEKIDKDLLNSSVAFDKKKYEIKRVDKEKEKKEREREKADMTNESLDPVVLIDGRPAKEGLTLDRQITLFYKMECCICHETGFHFRSLMKHYKDRHGVPGYVTCCDKKFHYFHPKKIIEHMAYHLQPNIFM